MLSGSNLRPPPRLLALLPALCMLLVSSCIGAEPPAPPKLFEVNDGEVYGPVLPPPISIRLGQSVLTAHGPVGPTDRPQGPPAIWEGHALSLDPDRQGNRGLYLFVQGDNLSQVSLQLNDQPPIVENNPGAYLSGQITMVRWAQDYSLHVTAENADGVQASAAIFVSGQEARVEGIREEPLRMRMLRQGDSSERLVKGIGFGGKLYRHYWPACSGPCDLTTPGGALIAMVSGPTDTLLLLMDRAYPYIAFGLSYWPRPNYLRIAIPVHQEEAVDIAALSRDGLLATGHWDRPSA